MWPLENVNNVSEDRNIPVDILTKNIVRKSLKSSAVVIFSSSLTLIVWLQ